MTWRDFSIYRAAHIRNQAAQWQQTRKIAYMVYAANTKKEGRLTESAFLPLITDEISDRGKVLTPEEIERAKAFYNKSANNGNGRNLKN